MLPRVVTQMIGRMTNTAENTAKVLVKSLGQTPVQIVLGMIIAVYIAFLESDKESLLSILMNNPMGRLLVMGFLAVLAVSAPPVAIMFAVLVVMSYSRSEMEVEAAVHHEGFWADDEKTKEGDDDKSVKHDDSDKKSKDKDGHSELLNQLSSVMKTMTTSKPKEGFGPMYEGAYNPDDDNFTNDEDAKEFMKSMNNLGGLVGYSSGDPEHSSP